MNIEGFHGWVSINGKRYAKDVIIRSDGEVEDRRTEASHPYRSEYFHTPLSEAELGFLKDEKPDVVIVGTGFKAMMLVTPQGKEILDGYEHHVVSTQLAIDMINGEKRKFVAILHLTC